MLNSLRDRLRASPILAGLALFFSLLVYFWLSGTLWPETWSTFWTSRLQLTGLALTNSAIPAFLVGSVGYASKRSLDFIEQLAANGAITREACERRRLEFRRIPLSATLIATGLGLLLAWMNMPVDYLGEALAGPTPAMDLSVFIGSLILWSVVAQTGLRGLRRSRIFSDLGRDDARVDLLDLSSLEPIGRFGTLNVLIVAGAMALMPLQSLDAELRWFNYANGFLIGIPAGVVLLLLPMRGIRARIRSTRATELTRLDGEIARAPRDLAPNNVARLVDLIALRGKVASVSDWPMDLATYRRIALYGIIPPVAWSGAALVERMISSMLG